MATTLTETPEVAGSVAMPDAGEPVSAATGPAGAIRAGIQKLTNRSRFQFLASYGSVGRRRIACSDNSTIVVSAPAGVVLKVGTVWSSRQQLTDFAAYSPAGIGANTLYYLYVRDNGAGALELVHSTTAPDSSLFYEAGDQTRAFLCCFATDSGSHILNFATNGFTTLYGERTADGGGVDGNLMLDNSSAIVDSVQPFNASVPPQARMVKLQVSVQTTDVTVEQAIVSYLFSKQDCLILNCTNLRASRAQGEIYPATARQFRYLNTSANNLLSVWCAGYTL